MNTKFKLKELIEDSITNWYWYGFISGDGNFSKDYLRITLENSDYTHLEKLSLITSSKLQRKQFYTTLCVGDKNNMQELKDKIGVFDNNKTVNSINFPSTEDDYLFSFIIGLIDADGCIEIRNGKAAQLKIELYHTWYDNLLKISIFFKQYLDIESKVLINKRNYALFRISGHKNILKIKKKAQELNIDYLNRKWNNILEDTTGCNFFKELKPQILKLYKKGDNLHKISKILNINYHSLFNHKQEIINESKIIPKI